MAPPSHPLASIVKHSETCHPAEVTFPPLPQPNYYVYLRVLTQTSLIYHTEPKCKKVKWKKKTKNLRYGQRNGTWTQSGKKWHRFYSRILSCYPAKRVKALKKTRITDPSQWFCLIFSLSTTTRLLRGRGAFTSALWVWRQFMLAT